MALLTGHFLAVNLLLVLSLRCSNGDPTTVANNTINHFIYPNTQCILEARELCQSDKTNMKQMFPGWFLTEEEAKIKYDIPGNVYLSKTEICKDKKLTHVAVSANSGGFWCLLYADGVAGPTTTAFDHRCYTTIESNTKVVAYDGSLARNETAGDEYDVRNEYDVREEYDHFEIPEGLVKNNTWYCTDTYHSGWNQVNFEPNTKDWYLVSHSDMVAHLSYYFMNYCRTLVDPKYFGNTEVCSEDYVWKTRETKRQANNCDPGEYFEGEACCPTCKTVLPVNPCVEVGGLYYMVIHATWQNPPVRQYTPVGYCSTDTSSSSCDHRTCSTEKMSRNVLVRKRPYNKKFCEKAAAEQATWYGSFRTSFSFMSQTTFVIVERDTFCITRRYG